MNVGKMAMRKIMSVAAERIFSELQKAAASPPGVERRIDLFNTGFTVDLNKAARKYLPRIEGRLRKVVNGFISRY